MGLLDSWTAAAPQGPGLLDLLKQAIGTNTNAPDAATSADKAYAAAQAQADQSGGSALSNIGSSINSGLNALFNLPQQNPQQAALAQIQGAGTGAPYGFGSAVIPQSANASATTPPVLPASLAAPGSMRAPNESGSLYGAPNPSDIVAASVPPGPQDIGPTINVPDGDTSGTAGSNGTGGLIGALTQFTPAVSEAAQSPSTSKGLLGALGGKLSNVGDSLKSLSPAASQGLLATGLSILANNDGRHNFSQMIGDGGISGLNAYNDTRMQNAAMAAKQQELSQTAQQNAVKNTVELGNLKVAQNKLTLDAMGQGRPFEVNGTTYAMGSNGQYGPISGQQQQVARTVEQQDPSTGAIYTISQDRFGNQIGQPTLKSNPNVGPLNESQQKVVNDANDAVATQRQNLQRTADLTQQVANADWNGGVLTKGNDWIASITGNKDASQMIRGNVAQMVNGSILQNLPPGSASDKDIELVRNGVPDANSGQAATLQWLQAYGRIQQAVAQQAGVRADYLTGNRASLAPANQPIQVGGLWYPAQTSYSDISTGRAQTIPPPQQQQFQQPQRPQQQNQQPNFAIPPAAALAELQRRRGMK